MLKIFPEGLLGGTIAKLPRESLVLLLLFAQRRPLLTAG